MTKTLTEQYKNKELSGWYYVKAKDGSINHWLLFTDSVEFETDKDIEEILAPVPSYDEVVKLEKKLEIATKALKGVCVWANKGNGGEMAVKRLCEKALKEMEGVK